MRRYSVSVLLIALTACALVTSGTVHAQEDPAAAQPEIEYPPRPELTGEAKTRVEELEKQITELRDQDKCADAVPLAEEVLAIRREHQSGWKNAAGEPAEWWEVGNARWTVQKLRLLVSLTSEQRAEVPEADAADPEVEELHGQGKYGEALVLTRTQLEIRRRLLGDDHPDTLRSINNMGMLFEAQGKLVEAEPYLREALEARRRLLGDDHPDTLQSINNMGFLLQSRGRLAEAEPYYHEALEGKRRVLGDDHPATLASIGNMACLFHAQGKFAEAEPYSREALKGRRRVLGDDHPETLSAASNIGALLKAQGKLAEAKAYCREALEGRRRVLGDDHLDTLASINGMGALLQSQGKLTEAGPYLREALDGRRRVLGNVHPDTLNSIMNMGILVAWQGNLTAAEPYYREALDGRRRVLGDDHPNTLLSIACMGDLLKAQGKLAKAEPYYRKALEGRRCVLGDNHQGTLRSINDMGNLFQSQGKLAEAEPYFRETLEGQRRVLGDDHRDTLHSIGNMGSLLVAQGKLAEAEPYHLEAMEGFRRVLGADHPDTLDSINAVGHLFHQQGELAEAEAYYREALEGSRRVRGDDHRDTLAPINNMGALLEAQGKLAEAEPYFREALEGYRRLLGDEHPSTLTSVGNMGYLLSSMGKLAEAEPYVREAMVGRRRVLGDDHPSTLMSLNNMGALLRNQGKLAEGEPYTRTALEGRRRVLGNDHPHTLMSVGNLAGLLDAQGKPAEAEPYCREALEGRRRVLGDDHPSTLTSIGNMGGLLVAQGKLAEAEPYHLEAMEGFRRVLGADHPDTLISMISMGNLLIRMGKFAEAEPYCREALAIAERLRTDVLGDERSRATYAGKLGLPRIAARLSSLLIKTDRRAEAWSVSERGRSRALLDILSRGEHDLLEEARARAEQAGNAKPIETLEAALRGEQDAKVDLTTAEARLAGITKQREHTEGRDDLGDEEKAERLARLDQQIAEQKETIKFKRRALGDASAKVFAELRGLFPDARPKPIEEILAALTPGELLLGYTWTGESAQLLVASPSEPGAQATGQSDSSLAGASGSDVGGGPGVRGFILANGKEEVEELTNLARELREAISNRPTDSKTGDYQEAADKLFAKLVPDAIREQMRAADRLIVLPDGPLNGIPFEALVVFPGQSRDREGAVASAARRPLPDGRGSDNTSAGADWRQAATEIVYAGSATMYLNRRTVARQKSTTGEASAVVLGNPVFDREPLPEPDYPQQGVLLAMVMPDSNAANAGLTRGDVLLSYGETKLPDPAALGPAIAAVHEAVESGTRKADDRVPVEYWRGGTTHETTLAPGRMGVRPSPGNAADGLRSMARLARGYEEATAEISATDQVRLHGGRLRPLPGTAREARSIAELFGGTQAPRHEGTKGAASVTLLLQERATIGELEAAVEGKRYVHLATHGLTGNTERPYDASLALTRPKQVTPGDIGFLRLDDLMGKWRGKLSDCELVVLSACDTQRGVKKGDSMMALPIGFMYAGAPTVVASLWKVDDEATCLLMEEFYRNLLERELPKAQALREAKRTIRNMTWEELESRRATGWQLAAQTTGDRGLEQEEVAAPKGPRRDRRPFEHPHYWAAFILIGSPD